MTIFGACCLGRPSRADSAGMEGAADLATWMPAVQRHMDASGVVPQLTVSLGHLPPLSSLLACSSSFSFSCGAAGSRTPSFGTPGSSDSPDKACSSSGCSTRHSGACPQHEHHHSQQVCAVAIVYLAIHAPIPSLGLRSKAIDCRPSSLGPPELCKYQASTSGEHFQIGTPRLLEFRPHGRKSM